MKFPMNMLNKVKLLNCHINPLSAGLRDSRVDQLHKKRSVDAVSRFGISTKLRGGGGRAI